jgi:hypothetical protein
MCYRNAPASYKIWWLPVRMLTDLVSVVFFLLKGQSDHAMAVLRAYGQFFKWIFSEKAQWPEKKSSLTELNQVFKHSIIAQYFLAKRKTWSSINPR